MPAHYIGKHIVVSLINKKRSKNSNIRQVSWNINQRVVARRAVVIFLPFFALVIGIATLIYFVETGAKRVMLEDKQKQNIDMQRRYIVSDVTSIVSDLMLLSRSSQLGAPLDEIGLDTKARAHLNEYFLIFADSKKLYNQVRLLDNSGMEIVRVEFNNSNVFAVSDSQLQDKRQRYYFKHTIALKRGEVFVSPLDLNIEHGQIEQPLKPMIRFGTPVFDQQGRKQGCVILNYLGTHLLDKFNELGQRAISQSMLLNCDGYWLKGPNHKDEWAFMYKDRKSRTFSNAYSGAWKQIKSQDSGQFETSEGLFTFATVYPLIKAQNSSSSPCQVAGSTDIPLRTKGYHWKIVSYMPAEILYAKRNIWLTKAFVFLVVLAVLLGTGSWLLSQANVIQRQAKKDLKNTELAEEAREQATVANESKSQFLANMSHEIRTPMNGVMSMVDLALDEELSDKARDYLTTANSSAKSLLTVINDILDISKIEAGKLDTEIIDCSVKQMLCDIDALMRPQAMEKGLEFGTILKTPVPKLIRTDPTRLQQCLINLVNNAVKFTDAGYVRVYLSLENRQDKPFIRFDVKDTGIGISADKQRLIFDMFIQADDSTTRRFGGTGLGLAITKKLSDILGGAVSVTSKKGEGSTFSLVIPVGVAVKSRNLITELNMNAKTQTVSPIETVKAGFKFTSRVLVVEDDPTNQKAALAILEKAGLQTDVANDGDEALQKAAVESYNLILMDMQMPNLNGYQATKTLREKGFTTPIIALTAYAMRGDAEKCIRAGCDDYLPKPLDRKKLFETLGKYLPSTDDSLSNKTDVTLKNKLGLEASENQGVKRIIDWSDLMARFCDEQVIEEIVESFFIDNPARIEALAEAVKLSNVADVESYSHALKGSAATIGATALSEAAYHLQLSAKQKNIETARKFIVDVQTEFERLKSFLSEADWIEIAKQQDNKQQQVAQLQSK